MKNLFLTTIIILFTVAATGQAIYEDERYVPETDPLVLEKLEQWKDFKFGLLMHWGLIVNGESLNPGVFVPRMKVGVGVHMRITLHTKKNTKD